MITRRTFVKTAAIAAAGTALLGAHPAAYAEEAGQLVEFTPDIAESMAANFAAATVPEKSLAVKSITPFYDEYDRLLGHIACFEHDGLPHGYVVFDLTYPDYISEFSLEEGAIGIHESPVVEMRLASETRVIRIDPLLFGVIDVETREGVDSAGNPVTIPSHPATRASDLDPYLINVSDAYKNYTVLTIGHVQQFSGFDESYLRSLDTSGRYACGVAAGFAVCDNYGTLNGRNMAGDFRALWNYVGPEASGGGWASTVATIGNGVRQFCSTKGKTVVGDASAGKPDYNKIVSCANSNNLSVLSLSIGHALHSVTVEGYATIAKGTNVSGSRMVMVFDGWHSAARFMYYDAPWNGVDSVFFSGSR